MPESAETPTQGAPAERTFTQAEMDAIIGDRLKRERAKYADYEDVKAKAQQFDAAQEKLSATAAAVERLERLGRRDLIEKYRLKRDRARKGGNENG